MNASERLVEAYFQLVGDCVTRGDVKVRNGVGRQFDLIAYKVTTGQSFHVETDVTHELGWCRTPQKRAAYIEKKFFGAPPKRDGASRGKTDFERGKMYFPAICQEYRRLGFRPNEITRVLVAWVLHEDPTTKYQQLRHKSTVAGGTFTIHFLSFRNLILPALLEKVGKSNYENEMLRALSLSKQRELQIGV